MSQRRAIDAKLRSLEEIRDILGAMKNMAQMEVRRLGRFLETQRRVLASMQASAADFRTFYPEFFAAGPVREVTVLLGSERGFCGAFNASILQAFRARPMPGAVQVLIVGSKLRSSLQDFPQAIFVENASVGDEIEGTLIRIIDTVTGFAGPPGAALRLTVFHHHEHGAHARMATLDLFEQTEADPKPPAYPPELLLDPAVFGRELMEQYLFARLHEMLYSSLLAENQARLEHLDSAVKRLERKSAEMWRRRNVLRQEEITEEIEVIMLSSETVRE